MIDGELVIEITRASGCIDMGALKPKGFYLEWTPLTAERKSASDCIKS